MAKKSLLSLKERIAMSKILIKVNVGLNFNSFSDEVYVKINGLTYKTIPVVEEHPDMLYSSTMQLTPPGYSRLIAITEVYKMKGPGQ